MWRRDPTNSAFLQQPQNIRASSRRTDPASRSTSLQYYTAITGEDIIRKRRSKGWNCRCVPCRNLLAESTRREVAALGPSNHRHCIFASSHLRIFASSHLRIFAALSLHGRDVPARPSPRLFRLPAIFLSYLSSTLSLDTHPRSRALLLPPSAAFVRPCADAFPSYAANGQPDSCDNIWQPIASLRFKRSTFHPTDHTPLSGSASLVSTCGTLRFRHVSMAMTRTPP